MKIMIASPEAVPYAKTGGLADVAGALPKALAEFGHDITLVLPLYAAVKRGNYDLINFRSNLKVKISGRQESFNIKIHKSGKGFETWLIEQDSFFGRSEIYRDPSTGKDWADNDERFAFFAKAVLESCRASDSLPHIIHCNDWQSGLIPAYLKSSDEYADISAIATLFSIHNIAYQGNFPATTFDKLGFDPALFVPTGGFEYWEKVSYLKAGLCHADLLNTVSQRYALEIQSSNEYGYGFEGVLKDRKNDLFGVLNGIDYDIWNPAIDNLIPANYTPEKLMGKAKCKTALRKQCKLPLVRKDIPIIGIISRLADQKGFDLIEQVAAKLLTMDIQIVVLGTGEKKYHDLFTELAKKHPKKLSLFLEFNDQLAHLIEAGSDMFLMPSRYEPCGLNQMYSLKYGTIPIVRETGGLADTIQNVNPGRKTGNGFTFRNYDAKEMLNAIKFACEAYRDKEVWSAIMQNGMKQDFSWSASAEKYIDLYREAQNRKIAGLQK